MALLSDVTGIGNIGLAGIPTVILGTSVTIGGTLAVTGAAVFSSDSSVTRSDAGVVDFAVTNSAATGSANARVRAYVSGASGGDPSIGVGITGVQDYFWSIDNSDSDTLHLLSNGGSILSFTSAGAAAFTGAVATGALTAAGEQSTTILKVSATGGNDALSFTALTAGSGGVMAALNDGLADYEPMRLIGETVQLDYRNGVGTSTAGLILSSAGKVTVVAGPLNIATTATPASAAATGVTGDIAWDASYVYVCTATNTWKRSSIATW